jgi:small-conductance mechanosensitive channel
MVVGTVHASEQWAVDGELRKRLLAAFAESGIEIPQPQRVMLTQTGRGGAAPRIDREPAPDRADIKEG